MDNEKRKRLATQIANDPNMLTFLEEMFIPEYSALHSSSEKNILALDDEQYGRAMKLFYLKREENRAVFETIKSLGRKVNPKGNKNAPQ
jgi:hypothetical protein